MAKSNGVFAQTSASALANAATRTLIEGSSFGDNIMAALPDVIGQTIGEAIAGGISKQMAEARAEREWEERVAVWEGKVEDAFAEPSAGVGQDQAHAETVANADETTPSEWFAESTLFPSGEQVRDGRAGASLLLFNGDTSGLLLEVQQGPRSGIAGWGPDEGAFEYDPLEYKYEWDERGATEGAGVGITISGATTIRQDFGFFANGGAITVVIPFENATRWDIYMTPMAQFTPSMSIAMQITTGDARAAFIGQSTSLDIGVASFTISDDMRILAFGANASVSASTIDANVARTDGLYVGSISVSPETVSGIQQRFDQFFHRDLPNMGRWFVVH